MSNHLVSKDLELLTLQDADMALARALQDQERAFLWLASNGSGYVFISQPLLLTPFPHSM